MIKIKKYLSQTLAHLGNLGLLSSSQVADLAGGNARPDLHGEFQKIIENHKKPTSPLPTVLRGVTMEPGAMAAPSQMWAPSKTVTPSPIKQLSSISQAWIIEPFSITTLFPIWVWRISGGNGKKFIRKHRYNTVILYGYITQRNIWTADIIRFRRLQKNAGLTTWAISFDFLSKKQVLPRVNSKQHY